MGQSMSTSKGRTVSQINRFESIDQHTVNHDVQPEISTVDAAEPTLIDLDELDISPSDLQTSACVNPERFFLDNQKCGEFRCIFEIARGRFGVMYLLKKEEDRLVFKCASKKESLLSEALILSKIKCKHVIEFKGFYELSNGYALAMGYSVNGIVMEFIDHERVEKNLLLCNDALKGLKFLHELKLAHFDIKPEHMLVDVTGKLVLSGFSSCKKLGKNESMEGFIGTRLYWSPQHFLDQPYRHAADVTAMTHSMIEIMFGVHIFRQINENNHTSIGSLVCDHPKIVQMLKKLGMSDEWVRVLSKSFRILEEDRPSVQDLMSLLVVPIKK